VLRPLQEKFKPSLFPNLIVGLGEPDDAAVYKLSDEQAIIQTVDFFPPVVDDAYSFGAIAAANALSDIYAMGGEVLFALNLASFPEDLPPEILTNIMRGGADKVAEAGAAIAGGHSVRDKEPKYGLSVTGLIHPQKIMTKGGAKPGDALVLTKPLGVGTVTTALKREQAEQSHVDAAIASMVRLNRTASHLARQFGAKSATDITGFGLVGHALEMATASQVQFQFNWAALPFLPGALSYGQHWIFPGGAESNEKAALPHVAFDAGISDWQRMMLFDPETSGGLLIALAPESAHQFLAEMARAGEEAWVVGEVREGRGIRVE
jgi:selenide,water dikinase